MTPERLPAVFHHVLIVPLRQQTELLT